MDEDRGQRALTLMQGFCETTGVTGAGEPQRYLWTDAHAVCNLLSLAQWSRDDRHLEVAVALVEQVHRVLGRHRADDARSGWISGLGEAEGAQHPTAGGLRIGKALPERDADAPYDERREWDRDGQYFHYLTRWMHALNQVASATGEARYHDWAVELAAVAHRRFRSRDGRLHWKMSIDLSRPQVAASGQHDVLDGLVTALTLARSDHHHHAATLAPVIDELATRCEGTSWASADPLGIGGLLFDAARLSQLPPRTLRPTIPALIRQLLGDARQGLDGWLATGPLNQPAEVRLAFREFGLSIGLQALPLLYADGPDTATVLALDRLHGYRHLVERIESFWSDPLSQRFASWTDHRHINSVMLASSLLPDGLLRL